MNHQGFIRGFETVESEQGVSCIKITKGQIKYPSQPDDGLLPLFDVAYQDDPPPLADGLTDKNYVIRFLKSKYTDWSYEQEVRAYISSNWSKSTEIEYEARALKQVIFGLRTNIEDMRKIAQATAAGGHEAVQYFKCYRDEHRFAVTIKEITDILPLLNENGS